MRFLTGSVALFLFFITASSHAQEFPIIDIFECSKKAINWFPQDSANWEVRSDSANCFYCISNNPGPNRASRLLGEYSLFTTLEFDDIILLCDIRLDSLAGEDDSSNAGLVFAYSDAQNYYCASVTRYPTFTRFSLLKILHGDTSVVAMETDTASFDFEKFTPIRIVKEAQRIKIFKGISATVAIIDTVDDAFSVGRIGVGSIDDTPCFDNVLVSPVSLEGPFADFRADTLSGEPPLEVIFSDASIPSLTRSDSIVAWQWDFNEDDIVDSYQQNPGYKFTKINSYDVKLKIRDRIGKVDSIIKKDMIRVFDDPATNKPPVVSFGIRDTTLFVKGGTLRYPLDNHEPVFTDPDGDALMYTVRNENLHAVEADVSGDTLYVWPKAIGKNEIIIGAKDDRNPVVTDTFLVEVIYQKATFFSKNEVLRTTPSSIVLDIAFDPVPDWLIIKYGTSKSVLPDSLMMQAQRFVSKEISENIAQNTKYFLQLVAIDFDQGGADSTFLQARTRVLSWESAYDQVNREIATDDKYSLIAIPYLADDAKFSTIFKREDYNNTELRVFGIDKSGDKYLEFNSKEMWLSKEMKPGFSYLASTREREKKVKAGVGDSFEEDDSLVVSLDYYENANDTVWYLGANPFKNPIEITSLIDSASLAQQSFYTLNATGRAWLPRDSNFTVNPFDPFLACIKKADSLTLYNKPNQQIALKAKRWTEKNWRVKVKFVNRSGAESYTLYAGVHPGSSDHRDFYDILTPPPWNRQVDFYFSNDSLSPGKFIGDSRTPGQDSYVFDMYFAGSKNEKYIVEVDANALPQHYDYVFVDETERLFFDEKFLRLASGANRFQLVIAKQDEMASVKSEYAPVPENFQLAQNYPNPFNAATRIDFDLPGYSMVELAIFNILGQKVQTLIDRQRMVGHHSMSWDGRDNSYTQVATGLYFAVLRSDFGIAHRKMILMR